MWEVDCEGVLGEAVVGTVRRKQPGEILEFWDLAGHSLGEL